MKPRSTRLGNRATASLRSYKYSKHSRNRKLSVVCLCCVLLEEGWRGVVPYVPAEIASAPQISAVREPFSIRKNKRRPAVMQQPNVYLEPKWLR